MRAGCPEKISQSRFRKVTRCEVHSACNVVGEIPDWDPRALDFADEKEIYNWNADFVLLTMAVCQEAWPPPDS